MKAFSTILLSICSFGAFAQLDLPKVSPHAEVKQRIGLTDAKISYSRPSVKSRKIWGALVPFGQLWRAGANEATTIYFQDPVVFGGQKLDSGKYSIFVIPQKKGEWTVKLNDDPNLWGTGSYDEKRDRLSIKVLPQKAEFTESLSFGFAEVGVNNAKLEMRWEKKKLLIPIVVDAEKKALANVFAAAENLKEGDWRTLTRCAEYCVQINKELDKAESWLKSAMEINAASFFPHWVFADLHAARKNYPQAIASAQKAIELGVAEQGDKFSYKARIERSIEEWKAKK